MGRVFHPPMFPVDSGLPVGPEYGFGEGNQCYVSSDDDRPQLKSLAGMFFPAGIPSVGKQEAEVSNSNAWQSDVLPVQYNLVPSGSPCKNNSENSSCSLATLEDKMKGTHLLMVEAGRRPAQSLQPLDKALRVQQKWTGKRPLAQRENHIWSERERRKGMNRLFCVLRSLLPEPTSKTDKSTVVGEIIKYIKNLRQSVEELTTRQSVLLHKAVASSQSSFAESGTVNMSCQHPVPVSASTSAVALHVCSDNVFLNMSCTTRSSLFVSILRFMRQHQLIVLNANVSTQDSTTIFCIHSKAKDINHFARESLESSLVAMACPIIY